jgi:hypothetical protein
MDSDESSIVSPPRVSNPLKTDWQRHVLASSGYLELGSPILNAMMKQGCCKNRRSMCGRYARTKAEILAEFFEFAFLVEEIAPRFNIAPTTQIPVARLRDDGQRELIALR